MTTVGLAGFPFASLLILKSLPSTIRVIDLRKRDKADRHRLQYFRYDEYLRNWDFFQNTFSKQAVTEGSLEKLADTDKDKEKIVTVDAFFLDEIEGWRKTLASDIARHNKDSAGHSILNLYDLNLAVQTIIDRIIFLKFAESRGMEAPDQFQGLEKSSQIYASLDKLFLQADKNTIADFLSGMRIESSLPNASGRSPA